MSALSTFWKWKIFKFYENPRQTSIIYNSADRVYTPLSHWKLTFTAVCIRTVYRVLDYSAKCGANHVTGRSHGCGFLGISLFHAHAKTQHGEVGARYTASIRSELQELKQIKVRRGENKEQRSKIIF